MGKLSVDKSVSDAHDERDFSGFRPPFVRSAYNYDTAAASDESGLQCLDPSLAQQNYKEECDINFIVDRFTRTGQLPEATVAPQFGDFTGISDYHSALNMVLQSQESFMSLPAAVRSRFANDPGELLAFLNDRNNFDEAVKLGLVNPRKEDLSPGGERVSNAQARPPVEKSGKKANPSVPASNEGGEGE